MAKTTVLLSAQQRKWFEGASARINKDRLKQLILDLTNIHSPTGAEREASQFLVDYLNSVGISAQYQGITETSGNCVGRVSGSGGGPTLLLYAPIDTHLDADPDKDIPWVGKVLRDDMKPNAYADGDMVIGLGASNPNSMICTLIEALTCVVEEGVELKGDVIIGSAGGGMPWVVPEREHAGISHGVKHMLSHGVAPDFGIIMKPWDEVYYEHPGMCWFKVTTYGTLGYAGIPRGTPGFTSSLVPAAKVILELEKWLTGYPDDSRHQSTQIKAQGWLSAVRSGWPEKPTFPAAATEIYLDVRTTPDQTNAALEAEFDALMRDIVARYDDVEAEWEMTVSCQASRTSPDHWIVQSAQRGWEERHGKPYPGAAQMAGQTDAATICQLGIPLVRIGYPWTGDVEPPAEFAAGLGGMGFSYIPDMIGPCQSTIYSIVDSCTRTREEIATNN